MSDPGPAVGDWACDAYGPAGPSLCFFESVTGACVDHEQCTARMVGERQRVFRKMQEMAAAGDPVFEGLSEEFASPSDLLNARQDDDDA